MKVLENSFECLFHILIVALFVSLNTGNNALVPARIGLGSGLILLAFFLPGFRQSLAMIPKLPLVFLAAFLLFQGIKAGYGLMVHHEGAAYRQYASGPLMWIFYAALVIIPAVYFNSKNRVQRFLSTVLFASFFVAVNALLPLLSSSSYGYQMGRQRHFFHPVFYSQQWMSEYVFGVIPNMNWVGDFLSFGVFAGLGMGFYGLYRIYEKKENLSVAQPVFCFFISMVNAAGIFILQSRGTMACFLVVFTASLFLLLGRMSPVKRAFSVGFACVFLAFVAWAGNLSGAMKEIGTLSAETSLSGQNSLIVNAEGAKRALRMFEAKPLFGVGRGNYPKAADEFADEGYESARAKLANKSPESHYVLQLAEEGAGSFIYFIFLFFSLGYCLKNVLASRSRFQSLAGLSLLAPLFTVFMHASINNLMDRFAMACLAYISLGILFGIFRKDFQHQA